VSGVTPTVNPSRTHTNAHGFAQPGRTHPLTPLTHGAGLTLPYKERGAREAPDATESGGAPASLASELGTSETKGRA